MLRSALAAIAAIVACCSGGVASELAPSRVAESTAAFNPDGPTASGMVLTFADEFDEHSVSTDGRRFGTRWTDHLWYEKPLPPGTTSTARGILTMIGNGGYGIATVNERGEGFSQRFGYFEARIRIPCGKGTWPAFWLISNDRVTKTPALPASELDIIEGQGVVPNGYFVTVHRDSANNGLKSLDVFTGDLGVGPLCREFHRYGLYWPSDQDKVTWYFNGRPLRSAAKFDTTDLAPMMVVLGNGYGDMIGSNHPDASTPRPSRMEVDYVRVWQFPRQRPEGCIGDCEARRGRGAESRG